jgi:hypothetical protein
MNDSWSPRSGAAARRLAWGAILITVAIGAQFGCTREFYREWANQDVSEAVFEKSRDPRWRIDVFSIEPPPLSRYAQPYDPELPPAPPDDPAAEALSPVPQWPDNRLLVPVEGTGYMDLLEYWRRDQQAKEAFLINAISGGAAGALYPPDEPEFWERPDNARHAVTNARQPGMPGQPLVSPVGPPVPPGTSSPFTSPPPLPAPGGSTPPTRIPRGPGGAAAPPAAIPPAPPAANPPRPLPASSGPQARNTRRPAPADNSLQIVRLQDGAEAEIGRDDRPRKAGATTPRRANSGTDAHVSTPISVSGSGRAAAQRRIPPPRAGASFARPTPGGAKTALDRSVSRAAFQESSTPARPAASAGSGAGMRSEILQLATLAQGQPAPPSPNVSGGQVSPGTPTAPAGGRESPGTTPRSGTDVSPGTPTAPRQPEMPRPGAGQRRPVPAAPGALLDREVAAQPPPVGPAQVVEAGRMGQIEAAELSQVLVPPIYLQNDAEAYGYPKGARVYRITMQQALLLALMNARFYQFNVEAVYLAALPVTLQRFSFEPQFYAGLSPLTGVPQINGAGGSIPSSPGVNTANSFNYATRFTPTGQISTLNLGTVAGFGKLFSTGGQLLMGFANEVAFNFVGKNPQQPTVISALPISFMQPLLRGGGRAVVLEGLTQAERNLLYAVRAFALFRQQFFVVTLTGGTIQNFGNTFTLAGFTTGGNSDPTVGFLPVVFNLVEVEVDRRNIFFLESLVKLYQELIQGETSGLSRLQVDQVLSQLISSRQALFSDKLTYRNSLDQFKMQMSLPPDTPLVVDMSLAQPFYDVFDAVDNWQRNAKRTLDELPQIIAKIPELEDIDVEGRSVLAPYRNYRSTLREFEQENEEGLEDTLQAAVRIALEYRMDLMNDRAQLYDAWRQIRFTANALKGILNVAITNNIYAPIANSNPLSFLSQAKQFGLTLNAELPLVRVNERNNFRTAIINYERTRRSLQTAEDNLKVLLRFDLRNVHLSYINYEIAKRNFELNVRLKDQAFEAIIAPPAGGTQALAQSANAAAQTINLLNFQRTLITSMLALTNGWQAYQTNRLIVYRDIGNLPYDEWEAFSELFPSQYHGPIIGQAPAGGAGFTPPPAARAAAPGPG